MADVPTGTGQSMINKNLSSILVTLIASSVVGLFTWGVSLNKTIAFQKDEYDKTVTELRDEIKAVDARYEAKIINLTAKMEDDETDIGNLQNQAELNKDDLKGRIIHLEDWRDYRK